MSSAKKTAIISPSGNLYGSEQVLLDFLHHCTKKYLVYIPSGSKFFDAAKRIKKHYIAGFIPSKLFRLYFSIFLKLLTRQINSVYVNEGGHIKYIKLLAIVFPSVSFTVHLRMVYDTTEKRLGRKVLANIKLIAISEYVAKNIPDNWKYQVVYDPYIFKQNLSDNKKNPLFCIGVIGRISQTKGFMKFAALVEVLKKEKLSLPAFYFYGTIADDTLIKEKVKEIQASGDVAINFCGFSDKESIYENIDCVCHFCEEEGLGRVFLEAIDAGKPFIGFKKGGLIEIADLFGLSDYLIEKQNDDESWIPAYIDKIKYIQDNYKEASVTIQKAANIKPGDFSIDHYLRLIEVNI